VAPPCCVWSGPCCGDIDLGIVASYVICDMDYMRSPAPCFPPSCRGSLCLIQPS
jgi:hypothetical protein